MIDRQLQRNTTKERSAAIGRNTLRNLRLLGQYPNAAAVEYNGAAVVVGAGPSLTHMLDRVRELQDQGVLVVTVNTALPALHKAGIVPNVLVSIEPVDASIHVKDRLQGIHLIVLDVSSNPAIWQTTDGFGRRAILLSNSSNYMRMCAELSTEPTEHGGSAMECAVSMVLRWGARTVALVGVDLSFPAGLAYAPNAGWDVRTAAQRGDVICFENPAERVRAHAEAGVEPPAAAHRLVTIEHTDGTAPSHAGYVSQIRGLERTARSYPRRNLVQTRGARLVGWGEDRDAKSIAPEGHLWCVPASPAADPEALERWIVLERRRCEALISLCEEIRSPARGLAHLALVESADLAETIAAGACLRAQDGGASRQEKIAAVYGALRDAASEVLRATA